MKTKAYLVAALISLGFLSQSVQATPLIAGAAPVTPGATGNPFTGATNLMSMSNPYVFAPNLSGTLNSWVMNSPLNPGGLTFVYQIVNTPGGTDTVRGLNLDSYQ